MNTRRDCLSLFATAAAAVSAPAPTAPGGRFTICAFSKHFQWTTIDEAAKLCADFGYEGVDITLRPGGHVEPARVEDDLPKAVEAVKRAGLAVPMVTSDIVDVNTPHAETVLKTLSRLGIHNYRWGGFRYTERVSIPDQLAELKKRVRDLAALNKHYGMTAMYHTHSGAGLVGASFWDLYILLKDFDANAVSVNFDIGHATVEGGLGGWVHSSRLLLPYTRGVAVKDFYWEKNAKGQWDVRWCALGQGMAHFDKFLPMLKSAGFRGPLQLHMEYHDLGGADAGKKTFTIPKDKLFMMYRRDVGVLKKMLGEAGML